MIAWKQVVKLINQFADEHIQINKFGAGSVDEISTFATKDEKYPILYIVPSPTVDYEEYVTLTFDCYCLDRLLKSRENYNTIINDTSLILSDLTKWLEEQVDVNFAGSINPLNNVLVDYTAGNTVTVSIDIEKVALCEIPLNPIPVPPTPTCDPVTLEVNGEEFTTIDPGETFDLPVLDGFNGNPVGENILGQWVVIPEDAEVTVNGISLAPFAPPVVKDITVKDYRDGNEITLSSISPNNADEAGLFVPNVDSFINDTPLIENVPGETKQINLIDESGDPYTGFTINEIDAETVNVEIDLPVCEGINSATPMKSGVTTSYFENDDGWDQDGRLVDWWNLEYDNYFGHRKRFTGIYGGYQDETDDLYYDKDGVLSTEAIEFPSAIIFDWGQWYRTNEVFTFFHTISASLDGFTPSTDTLTDWIANEPYQDADTFFNDWKTINIPQGVSITNWGGKSYFGYPPINQPVTNNNSKVHTKNIRADLNNFNYAFSDTNSNINRLNLVSSSDTSSTILWRLTTMAEVLALNTPDAGLEWNNYTRGTYSNNNRNVVLTEEIAEGDQVSVITTKPTTEVKFKLQNDFPTRVIVSGFEFGEFAFETFFTTEIYRFSGNLIYSVSGGIAYTIPYSLGEEVILRTIKTTTEIYVNGVLEETRGEVLLNGSRYIGVVGDIGSEVIDIYSE